MNDRPVEFESLAIVILGSFNPAIFHPLWFSQSNLIRKEEAEGAKVQFVHGEVSSFTSDWLTLQSTRDRLQMESKDPTKNEPLRDIALGTLKILEHTPVSAFGLNRHRHYRMKSLEQFHEFGHFYAPKAAWEGILKNPGLRSLIMEGKREGDDQSTVRVRLESSEMVEQGILVHVHEHHAIEAPKEPPGRSAEIFQSELNKAWPVFLSYSEQASTRLFEAFDRREDKKP